MKTLLLVLLTASYFCNAALTDNSSPNLIVYGPVPGLAPSDHYAVRVRPAGVNSPWQSAFVFKTAGKDFGRIDLNKIMGKTDTEGYAPNLSGWSHSYVNFEMTGLIEVEISKMDGVPIRKATVHPVRYGKDIHVKDGKELLSSRRCSGLWQLPQKWRQGT